MAITFIFIYFGKGNMEIVILFLFGKCALQKERERVNKCMGFVITRIEMNEMIIKSALLWFLISLSAKSLN